MGEMEIAAVSRWRFVGGGPFHEDRVPGWFAADAREIPVREYRDFCVRREKVAKSESRGGQSEFLRSEDDFRLSLETDITRLVFFSA
jgi:hypothetical protein